MRVLFDLAPVEVESDFERAFQVAAGRKRSLVIIFTDLVDPAAARTLIAAVPVLVRRHAVIVAGSTDPDLEAALTTDPLKRSTSCGPPPPPTCWRRGAGRRLSCGPRRPGGRDRPHRTGASPAR